MMDNQDNGQSTSEKVSIPVAAKALKVSTKTVHRYIEKGILSKVKEGTRVYVHLDEVKSLLSGQPKIDKTPRVHEKDRVTVDRTHYDSLLVRLGQLEANQQLLLEYKEGLQAKDRELEQARADAAARGRELARATAEIEQQRARAEAFRAEVERLRLPFWRRWFSKIAKSNLMLLN